MTGQGESANDGEARIGSNTVRAPTETEMEACVLPVEVD
jgi:hypothetical protein